MANASETSYVADTTDSEACACVWSNRSLNGSSQSQFGRPIGEVASQCRARRIGSGDVIDMCPAQSAQRQQSGHRVTSQWNESVAAVFNLAVLSLRSPFRRTVRIV